MSGGNGEDDRANNAVRRPMGWLESVVTAGFSGGRLATKPVSASVEAVERNIRGDARRRAAEARVDGWRRDLAARDTVTLAELDQLVRLTGAHGSVAFLDIEVRPGSSDIQVGLCLDLPERQHMAGEGPLDVATLQRLIAGRTVVAHNGREHDFPILERAGVRFSPGQVVDSMLLAMLAWPTSPSHSLGALLERQTGTRVDPEQAHTAAGDARTLALLWSRIVEALASVPARSADGLRDALTSVGAEGELAAMVSARGAGAASHTKQARPWRIDPGAPRAPTAVISSAASAGSATPSGAVRVVRDLREHLIEHPASGVVVHASRVLDEERIANVLEGWDRAVALRLIDEGDGLIDLAPVMVRERLVPAAREQDAVLVVDGPELATDHTTVVTTPLRHHLIVDGARVFFEDVRTGVRLIGADLPEGATGGSISIRDLAASQAEGLRFQLEASSRSAHLKQRVAAGDGRIVPAGGGIEWLLPFPDPSTHEHGVTVLTPGPVGGARSRAMWQMLLGHEVAIEGPATAPKRWRALDGIAAAGRVPGRRPAQLLAVAATLHAHGSSALVVDTAAAVGSLLAGDRSEDDVTAAHRWRPSAPRVWHKHTGTSLLRPPTWPTVDEARRRLREPHVVLVTQGAAWSLCHHVDHVLVGRSMLPSSAHPTVDRMYRQAGDAAFAEVAEPLGAHLTAELVAGTEALVTVVDPDLAGGVLVDLIGMPEGVYVDDLDPDKDVRDELLVLVDRARGRGLDQASIDAAVGRILGESGELRPFQRSVIEDVASRNDVMAVFRTGLGKSVCYQVPAVAWAGHEAVTLVISPLIALQRDQIDGLRKRGIHEATLLNSGQPSHLRSAIRRGITSGFYKIVLVAPEALHSQPLIRALSQVDVALVAIDEAHCISEMGHDFRPDYRTLPASIRKILGLPDDAPFPTVDGRPSFLTLTGTASPDVRRDITEALR